MFKLKGFQVYATYHERSPPELDVVWIKLNLESEDSVVSNVREIRPEVIVHSAAYTDVDGCEINKERAFKINYLGTNALAQISRDVGLELLIYVSTDYVFDGEKGLYTEYDIPAPVNYYGLTKLLGEISVRNSLPRNSVIVRVSGLYGYSPIGRRNFGIIALEKLLKRESIEAFSNQWLSPTYVKSLAEVMIRIVEEETTGIIHIAGERMSRYEFAVKLAEALGVERDLVRPKPIEQARLIAKRPKDSSLNTSKSRELGLALPPIHECIEDMILTYRKLLR